MAFPASLNWLKGQTIELLFPGVCTGCGKSGSFFCPACRKKLPYLKGPVCPSCGRPGAGVCSECRRVPPQVESVRSPFTFDGAIRSAIHQFKYKDIRSLARPLAEFLHTCARDNGLSADCLVPVPLHRSKLRERGYNQAELLAGELARLTGWPVDRDTLIRTRDPGPQARAANAAERRHNVAGIFSCNNDRLKGKSVLLIDDVCTTGATLDACARVLRELPGITVSALVLAREL